MLIHEVRGRAAFTMVFTGWNGGELPLIFWQNLLGLICYSYASVPCELYSCPWKHVSVQEPRRADLQSVYKRTRWWCESVSFESFKQKPALVFSAITWPWKTVILRNSRMLIKRQLQKLTQRNIIRCSQTVVTWARLPLNSKSLLRLW